MKKRMMAVLVMATCMLSFAGCGAKESGMISEIEDGVLTVGTNAAFPPFEYVGEDGKPAGFDIALIEAIGEELGVEVEVQDMEFDSLVAAIGSKIDVAIAGMTVTDERKEQVDFSDPYYDAVQYVLVAEGSDIASYDDLKGKAIGSQLGTTGDFLSEDIQKEDDSTSIHTYNKAVDAVTDLSNGRLDAVILDKNPAEVFASEYDGIVALDGADFNFETEEYAIALPKGSEELQKKINEALQTLKDNGTYDKLVETYIETE